MTPDISYVMAAHNAAPWIEDAIRSALDQRGARVEIIVVDDASTDATKAIVSRMAEREARITLIHRPISGGPAAARNSALARAQGEWIGVLDADDLLDPERSHVLITLAEQNGGSLIADNLLCFPEDGQYDGSALLQDLAPQRLSSVDAAAYLRGNLMTGGARNLGYLKPIVRRSFIEQHDISYDERLRIGEDFDFCLRCIVSGAPLLLWPEPLYRYRLRRGSTSRQLIAVDLAAVMAAHAQVFNRALTPAEQEANHAFLRSLSDMLAYVRLRERLRDKSLLGALPSALNAGAWRAAIVLARRKLGENGPRSRGSQQPQAKSG